MIPSLEILRQAAVLGPLDVRFASTLSRIGADGTPEVGLAAAMLASRVSEGHVCLDLREIAGCPPAAPEGHSLSAPCAFPKLSAWLGALERSPLVRGNGERSPLVLEGPRLYLRRYHEYETAVAEQILARIAAPGPEVDEALLRDGLRRLFPAGKSDSPDWQRVAAAASVIGRFTVISGGPGTGKTWTVARILPLLVEQGIRLRGRAPRIHLLAPTGKAAARLRESIRESKKALPIAHEVRTALPDEASTIHRLLGTDRHGGFRHRESHPLIADAVVVDEASMVDLALMAALLGALPAAARVILLGDRDQLASVEAGSVLADICGSEQADRISRFSAATARRLRALGGDEVPEGPTSTPTPIVYLRESHRFADHPSIGRVAEEIRTVAAHGSAARVLEAIRDGAPDVALVEPSPSLEACLAERVVGGYRPYLDESDLERKLDLFDRFRVLSAHRRGADGVEALNEIVEKALAGRRLIRPSDPSYPGRPILVTRNDPSTRLFNGDVGIVVAQPGGARKALFRAHEDDPLRGDARLRLVSLARLPAVESAFGITVHKSQGSEFDHVVIVLPERESPVTTRELLYTAVTRATEKVTIVGRPSVIAAAVRIPTRRSSGLRDRLTLPGSGSASPSPR